MILKIALIVVGAAFVIASALALYVLWVVRDIARGIGDLGDEYLQGNIR